jgi:hypothetical protein
MKLDLEPGEISYLLRLIAEHRTYYGTLAGSGTCTAKNLALHRLVQSIGRKLDEASGVHRMGMLAKGRSK